jgi:hypothetical protein
MRARDSREPRDDPSALRAEAAPATHLSLSQNTSPLASLGSMNPLKSLKIRLLHDASDLSYPTCEQDPTTVPTARLLPT